MYTIAFYLKKVFHILLYPFRYLFTASIPKINCEIAGENLKKKHEI
jgi:hypothetical protein